MDDAVTTFLDAAGSDQDTPDAAATPDAAGGGSEGTPDLFEMILSGEGPPAHDAAPDEGDAAEPDPLGAEDDPYAASDDEDADEDGPETLEARIARLEAENAEYLQAKRDAEANAATEQSRAYWSSRSREVDSRKQQAIAWLAQEATNRGYDGLDWAMGQLPRIIESYAAELTELKDEQIRATWDVARRHASQTYVQKLKADFALSDAEVSYVAQFAPEEMERAAQLIARVREQTVEPVKRELTTTKGQLTKAQRANARARHAQMPAPAGGRTTVVDFARARNAITEANADAIAGRLFDAMGLLG
jgi:hypothetical protein